MSAVGYCRISELDQSNTSLEDQAQRIKEYCANNGITLQKIFIDNGKSAFTFDRPEWKQLEVFIKKHKDVKYLIVKHIDRFSRAKLMDALIKLNEIEVKLKVKVLSVTDPLNLDTKDFSVELMRTLNLLFSNNERNRIQDRVKDGVYRSLSSGRWCNMAPIGYKNSQQDGKPLIVIDESKATLIRKMFTLANEGMGIEEIRRTVQKAGLKVKGNSSIQRILKSSVYAGIIQLPAYKGQPAREVTGIHKPIISRSLFYLVQSKLLNKGITIQRADDVWLRGVLYCHCGRPMTAGNSKGRTKYYWYYKCPEHKENIPAKKLHDQYVEILKVVSFTDHAVEYFREKLNNAIDTYQKNKGGNIMRTKLDLDKIKKKINQTQERYLLNPDIEPKVYAKVIAELESEKIKLETDVSSQTRDTAAMHNVMTELLPRLKDLPAIFEGWDIHQKQLFIRVQFSRPLYLKNGIYRTATIHPLFADKVLILKQKRLIEIDKTFDLGDKLPASTRDGS